MTLRVIAIVPPCSEVIEAELLLAEKIPLGLWRTPDSPKTRDFLPIVALSAIVAAIVIGVMAVGLLLPPAVSTGLLLGSGHRSLSLGEAFLLLANVICVNLAGVIVFPDKGVRPRTGWETRTVRSASRKAILVWSVLVMILIFTLLTFPEL